MKNFQILKYLRKLLPIIMIFCLLATSLVYVKLNSSNTYIASEVIHYNNEAVEQGFTPTWEKFDVNEIKASSVISKVIERMDLGGTYSVDTLISRVTITPVPDEDKVAQKEAMLEEGEEYIYEPSTFVVSFYAKSGEGEEFARTVLDEILDVYFAEYSQKYVNVAPANNVIEKLNEDNYDYIEILELIDNGIESTLEVLGQRIEYNAHYRSSETGVSLVDLYEEFYYVQQVKVSELFSKVYKYQITNDKHMLVSDYTTRIDNNDISNENEDTLVADILLVIDAYVDKMRESGNTNITYEYILEEVHDKNMFENNYSGDQTVTYDELIYGWRDHNEAKEHAIIDSAYCNYVIDTFERCTGECGNGECKSSNMTCTELHNEDYDEIRTDIDEDIDELIAELTNLYTITKETNDEYNEYIGAQYISVLSTSSVKESVNVTLYTLLAFVFLVVVCCGGTVILVRLADIVSYVFYRDHLTGFSNRAFFDKHIKSHDNKPLLNGDVCCVLEIANYDIVSTQLSPKECDDVVKNIATCIKSAFGSAKATFIYNGNGNFVVFVKKSDCEIVRDIIELFNTSLGENDVLGNAKLEYKVGIAESSAKITTIRRLISEAIKDKNSVKADIEL